MKSQIKILHLEDNENDAMLVKETLLMKDINCEIIHVDNKTDFIENLEKQSFDIILADYNLPSFDGLAALELGVQLAPNVPFIFISGVLGEELAIETLKRGATDYVIKSRLERLVPAVERALRELEDKAQRIRLEREIVELEQMIGELKGIYDQLTKRVRGFLKIELPSGKYSIVDKFLEDLSGYQIKDWQETPNFISQLIHPDFKENYIENIEQFKDGIVPKMLEYKIMRKDGEERWWLQFNIGAFDAQGKLTSVSAVIIDNTEDKETQEKYQDLFENALTGMFRSDIKTGEIFEANEKMAQILGCSSVEEFKKYKATDFYSDINVRKELIENLRDKGINEEFQVQMNRVDGSTIWVSESIRIYPDEGYLQGLLVDITERKLAENALKRDRKAFQIIADASVHAKTTEELSKIILDGLVDTFDFDAGTFRSYNKESQMLNPIAISGIEEDKKEKIPPISITNEKHVGALVGRTKRAIFAPDVLKNDATKDIKPQLDSYHVRSNITWPILTAEDELIGVLQLVSQTPKEIPEKDRSLFETIADMLASALELKKADEALRESEEKFRAFAEQSLFGVSLTSVDGDFIFLNDEIIKISEFSREEFHSVKVGDIIRQIFKDEDLNRLRKQIQLTMEEELKASPIEEYQITSKSGKIKWVSIHLTQIKIKEEYVTGIVILEITEQKRAQLTLERERKAFHMLAEAIVNAKDISDLCQRILAGLTETMHYAVGTFRIYDKDTRTLYPIAMILEEVERQRLIQPLSIDDPTYLNTYVAKTKEPVFAPNVSKHSLAKQFQKRLNRFRAKSIITWPILNATDELLGTIQLVAHQPKEIPEEDRFFFETIVRFLASALEKVWSEEALHESQELYRRLIETSPFAIINTDLEGDILMVNHQALHTFTISDESDIIGKNFFDFISKEERKKAKLDVKIAANSGVLRNIEYLMLTRTGKSFPFETSISVILNEEQKAESFIFIGQNIALRKDIEERQKRLTNIIEHSEQVVISADPAGKIIFINPAVERVFGYKVEELVGQHMSILVPPEQEVQLKEILEEVMKIGKLTVNTIRKHKDGSLIPVVINITTDRDESGKLLSINGIIVDISNIKRLEESLRSRYHEFEVLNKVISAGYCANNLDQFFDFALDTMLNSLDFTGGAIYLIDDNVKQAEIKRSIGLPKILLKNIQNVSIDSPQFKRLFVSGETVVLENFTKVEQLHDSLGVKSLISVPFFSKQKIIGALMLISNEKRAITDEDKRILEAIGRDTGTAIAKFKAEEELISEQFNLTKIFDALEDMLLVLDIKTGRIVLVNKAAQKTLGFSEKQLTKMTLVDLHPDGAKDENLEKMLKLARKKNQEFKMNIQSKDGGIIACSISIYHYIYENRDVMVCILKKCDALYKAPNS